VNLFTMHASSGVKEMRKAVEKGGASKVIAVTALTSMDEEECIDSYGVGTLEAVDRFRQMAYKPGVRLLVCAPRDAEFFLTPVPDGKTPDMVYICPNIRPVWAATGDQNKDRSMTPSEAAKAGITYMVIGRPITKPPPQFASRRAAAEAITLEIYSALSSR
jgi:orotidine-5'-phosphate decarboxylase